MSKPTLPTVKRGSDQWKAWQSHYQESDPKLARVMEKYTGPEGWTVPSEYPPLSYEREKSQ